MFTKIFIILVVSLALFGTNTMGSTSVARTAIATANNFDQRKLLRTAGGDKKHVNAFNDDEIGPEDFAVVTSQHMMSESDEARLLQNQSSDGSVVIGLVIWFAIIAAIVVASCACCKCCPWYPHMCCAKDNGGCGEAQTGAAASTGAATAQTRAATSTGAAKAQTGTTASTGGVTRAK
jgi:hypothetical protein